MGNTNTLDTLSNHDFEYNLKAVEYTAVKRFRDFLLGDFYEMKHDLSGRTLLMKVRPLANIQKYQESIERTMKRLSLSHKNLVKIKGFVGRETQNTKPPAYKLHIYFQHLPRDLSKFLKTRRNVSVFQGANTQKYLSEAELSEIMTQLIDVLEYLQVNGISHGDIRPEACFRSDEGQIVICDRKLIYEEDIDLSTQKNSERHFLFSPAMLEFLIKKSKRLRENKHKGDVFSLGMTLLECATLRRSTGVYEWTGTPAINFGAIINRLSDVKTRYSPKLCQMIAEMLKFDESQRPDFIQLKRWIDGTESMSYRTASFASLKRGSVGPSMNRSSIGPKLVGGSPILRAVEESEIVIDSSSTRDKTLDGTVKKKNNTEKDDEDEVVEFETEQTPKTSPLMDSQQSYLVKVNNNHMPLVFRHKQDNNKNAENLKFSLGHQHDPQGFINRQDSDAPILDFNMRDKGDTNWALSNIFTAMNKTLSSPNTASTEAHSKTMNKSRHGSLSPERESSPSLLDRSPKRPLKIDIPSKTMPSLKLNLGNLSPLRACEQNAVDTLLNLTSRNKPVNPMEVLRDSYGTIQEITSPRDTLDLKFYNSPRNSRQPLKFDSSASALYPELAGETTEQWRSSVFEGTYNSINSLNSPKSGGNLDLLSQQLRSGNCSLGASPMNTLSNASLKGFSDVCNRVGSFHQSKSSLEGLLGVPSSENTRKSGSFTTRAGFSTSQLGTERPSFNHSHKFSDYGFPPPIQSQREPVRKSTKATTCDPKFLQAEIDQIWRRTSISKNNY